jgi:hypothetical protein
MSLGSEVYIGVVVRTWNGNGNGWYCRQVVLSLETVLFTRSNKEQWSGASRFRDVKLDHGMLKF